MELDFSVLIKYAPKLIDGVWVTLSLLVISLFLGALIAVGTAFLRLSDYRLMRWPAFGYIYFFRGTPVLVQLYLVYFGLGESEFIRNSWAWDIFKEAFYCAILAITLNNGAYTAEILRGAYQALPKQEIEACRACGMSGWTLFRRFIMPRTLRLALPAYGNEVILLMKASALVSTITVVDLMGAARGIVAKTFGPFEPYIAAGLIYLLMTFLLTSLFKYLEHYFHPEQRFVR